MVIQNHKQRNWEEMVTRSGNDGQTIHRRHKWTVHYTTGTFVRVVVVALGWEVTITTFDW